VFHKAYYILFYYAYFYNIATLMMRPFSNLYLFSHAKEIKGIGFLKLMG